MILFGNEEGAAETAGEFGARHETDVERNSLGTPLLSSLFDRADRLARHDRLCFLNADILLTDDFLAASNKLAQLRERSLMVGRRCDLDITEPLDFSVPDWGARAREQARERGKMRPAQWIDYFVFPRGLLSEQVPPFAVGRPGYDNWLLWKVRSMGVPVVDATQVVRAIHQNHDYLFHPGGITGLWKDVEAIQNRELRQGHFATIDNATHRLYAERFASELLSLGRAGQAQSRSRTVRCLVRPVGRNATSAPAAGPWPQSRGPQMNSSKREMTTKISVLIDTYNHERFIERAIRSVLEQDMPMDDVEILVVDDGSTDQTPEIVQQFGPHVRLIRKPNGGQASAFNVGFSQARGQILATLDGDDWWAREKLRRVVETLDANPDVGFVGHGFSEEYADGRPSGLILPGRCYSLDLATLPNAELFRHLAAFFGTSRMTIRRSVLDRILPIPEELNIEADEFIFTALAPAVSRAMRS